MHRSRDEHICIHTHIYIYIYNASKHAGVVLPAARRVFPAKRREQRELFLLLATSRRSRSRGKEEAKKFALFVVVWIEREFALVVDEADASNRGVCERADENEVSVFKRGCAYDSILFRASFFSFFALFSALSLTKNFPLTLSVR